MSNLFLTIFEGHLADVTHCVEITCKSDCSEARLVLYTLKPRWSLKRGLLRPHLGRSKIATGLKHSQSNIRPCPTMDSGLQAKASVQLLEDLFYMSVPHRDSRRELWTKSVRWVLWRTRPPAGVPSGDIGSQNSLKQPPLEPRSGIWDLELFLESGRTTVLSFPSAEDRDQCMGSLVCVIKANRLHNGYPDIEYAWSVTVKLRKSDAFPKPVITGRHYFCLTDSELLLVQHDLRFPKLVILYSFVRQCASRRDGQFRVHIGRASPIGECELVLQLADVTEATFVHSTFVRLMKQFGSRTQLQRLKDTPVPFRSGCPPLPVPQIISVTCKSEVGVSDQICSSKSKSLNTIIHFPKRLQSYRGSTRRWNSESCLSLGLSGSSENAIRRKASRTWPCGPDFFEVNGHAATSDQALQLGKPFIMKRLVTDLHSGSNCTEDKYRTRHSCFASLSGFNWSTLRHSTHQQDQYLDMNCGDPGSVPPIQNHSLTVVPATCGSYVNAYRRLASFSHTQPTSGALCTNRHSKPRTYVINQDAGIQMQCQSSHRDNEELFADVTFDAQPFLLQKQSAGISSRPVSVSYVKPTRISLLPPSSSSSTKSNLSSIPLSPTFRTRPRTCSDATSMRRPTGQLRTVMRSHRCSLQNSGTESQDFRRDNAGLTNTNPSSCSLMSSNLGNSTKQLQLTNNMSPQSFSSLKLSSELGCIRESQFEVNGPSTHTPLDSQARPRAYTVGFSQFIGKRLSSTLSSIKTRLSLPGPVNCQHKKGKEDNKTSNQHSFQDEYTDPVCISSSARPNVTKTQLEFRSVDNTHCELKKLDLSDHYLIGDYT
ncbi:hypothetical protein PHET_02390 [Paragonimus heterotremus]|uniref:IRS-type PTB domain-containing protein n=1 Tax=Paragonimus heterotremus TaxID=100268 RepID=A0A8J4T475_9TREM|nr:hypothetical protein PHET_02390 [Paragonimus heterotremus]